MNGQECMASGRKESGPLPKPHPQLHLVEFYLKNLKGLSSGLKGLGRVELEKLDSCDDLWLSWQIENLTRYQLNQILISDTASDLHKHLAVDLLKLKPYPRLLLIHRNLQPGVKDRMYKDLIEHHPKSEAIWLTLDILEGHWMRRHNLTIADLRPFYQMAGGAKII